MKKFIIKAINESLYANSSYLLSSWIVLSVFGFVFWTICTHLYSDEQVGIAVALLAALNLITSLSLMGFELSIIRIMPAHPDKSSLFNILLTTVAIFGAIFSVLFMVFVPYFSSDLTVVRSNPATAIVFVLFVLIALTDYMLSNTFIAYRKSDFTLRKNLVFSVSKLGLPFLLVAFGAYGIFSAWMISLGVAVIYGLIVLTKRFNHTLKPQLGIKPLKGMIGYSFGNYLSSFAEGLPIMVLPILIVNVYSPAESAYYYIAMMFATLLFTISTSATQSLFAEASHDRAGMMEMIKKVFRFLGLLLIPGVIFIVLLGPYLLRIFGSAYQDEATGLLRILALASVLTAFNSIARTIFRVNFRTIPLTVVSFIGATVIIALSYLLREHGLSSVGVAWLLGETVSLVSYGLLIARGRDHLLAPKASR